MKFIITTDNQDKGWLDSFNKWMGNSWEDFKMNQQIEEEQADALSIVIEMFNNEIACGKAIRLEVAE